MIRKANVIPHRFQGVIRTTTDPSRLLGWFLRFMIAILKKSQNWCGYTYQVSENFVFFL
jgi:hypothetical protein